MSEPAAAADRHVADSLVALDLPAVRHARRIADLGSGAGWPGLALAAALPDARVALVESAIRHCRYLERAVAAGRLENARRGSRARGGVGRRAAARMTSSPPAPLAALPVLCEYAAPLLADGGVLVAWKGAVDDDEAADGATAAALLGLEPVEVLAVEPYPAAERRTLHVYRKVAPDARAIPAASGNGGQAPFGPPDVPLASRVAMGIVYAIANQKGGVGKTTTAVNVAACIAEAGYDTLLVDVDPQGNATTGLGIERNGAPGLYGVLGGEIAALDAVRPTAIEHLSLLASTPDLAGATMELPRLPGSETRLRDALAGVRERFAYTLLDCPPSLGPLTVNALVAADRVIVPVQTEYFALEGLAGLLDTLSLVQRELNPRLTVAGMLLTMHDGRTKLAQDVEREVRQHFPALVFDTVIPRNIRLGEAPSFGRPVIHHDPYCAGSEAYFALAKEVASRG